MGGDDLWADTRGPLSCFESPPEWPHVAFVASHLYKGHLLLPLVAPLRPLQFSFVLGLQRCRPG
jgi:hypothetical protein